MSLLSLLLLGGCGPAVPEALGPVTEKAPSGEYCDGEDNDADGVVDEDCGACDMLYTRVRSWWRESQCVIEGQGTGLKLTPLRVGSTNNYATADTLLAFLASPGNTDKQRLGQQIAVGKLNSRAFGIGGLPYHDVDADGDLETVDELLARADQVFDAPDTAAQASMFALLGAMNAEGNALPVYIDQNCARDAEYCDGLDNDGDGSTDEDCGCVETCDGVDNNGDGAVDESGPDNDADGYQCDDCDDARYRTNPGAYDVPENAIDDDCDGVDPQYTYDFDTHIQPIFDASCTSCHSTASPAGGLDLSVGNAYANIVEVPSSQVPSYDRVQPASTSLSYLYRKVMGTHTAVGGTGARMPDGGPYLSFATAGILGTWITEGAPPSCPDGDGDGWDCTDCDDTDPTVYPGAPEVRGDEIDQDCDDADLLFTYGLEGDIQPLYDAYCTSCHGATTAALGLRLDAGFSQAHTLNVPAAQLASMDRIEPGDHTRSYVYHKVAGTHGSVGGSGNRMPRGGTAWLPELLELYALWIDEGAPDEACPDADGDVFSCSDCDDANAAVRPGAVEICDGIDNNCDGVVDDDAAEAGLWFADADGDGFGDAAEVVVACEAPAGFVAVDGDCDDLDATAFPGAVEVCDGVDNTCDGVVDEGVTGTFYADVDGDGYGDAAASTTACAAPAGFVVTTGDCDDGSATTSPGASEACDGVDNDCDGTVDDGWTTTWYRDADGDGYGVASTSTTACAAPAGYVADATDCDDTRNTTYPGATEVCTSSTSSCTAEGRDNDCDGAVDDGCGTLRSGTVSTTTTWSGTNLICNDVTVSTAGWLTIADGAVVRVRSAKKLSVQGQLDVLGTDAAGESFVTFEPETATAGPGGWGRIEASGATARVNITGAVIDRPQQGVYSTGGGAVEVVDSEVREASSYGVYQNTGSLWLERSSVSATGSYGVYVSGAVADLTEVYVEARTSSGVYVTGSAASVTATGLVITNPDGGTNDGIYVGGGTFSGTDVVIDRVGDRGLYVGSSATATLTDATVIDPGGEGVYCAANTGSCTLTRVDITGAGTDGVYFASGSLAMTDSSIVDSADDGVYVSGDHAFTLAGTTITGSGGYPIELVYAMTLEGVGDTNVLTGNVNDTVAVSSGAVTRTMTWLDPGVPVLDRTGSTDPLRVSSGATLTLGAGFTLDLDGGDLIVGSSSTSTGGLELLSNTAEPVTFDNGRLVYNYVAGPVSASYLVVRPGSDGGILVSRYVPSFTLTDARVEDGTGTYALYANSTPEVMLENVTLSGGTYTSYALYLDVDHLTATNVTVESVTTSANYVASIGADTSADIAGLVLEGSTSTSSSTPTGVYLSGDSTTSFTVTDLAVDGARGRGVYLTQADFALAGMTVTGTTSASAGYPGDALVMSSSAGWTATSAFHLTGNAGAPARVGDLAGAAGLDLLGTYTGNGQDAIVLEGTNMDSGASLTLADLGVPYSSTLGISVQGTLVLDGAHLVVLGTSVTTGSSATEAHTLTCLDCVIERNGDASGYGVIVNEGTYNAFYMTGGEVFGFLDGVSIRAGGGAGSPTVQMSGYTIHDSGRYGLWCDNGCTWYESTTGNSVLGGTFYNNGTDVFY